MSSLPQYKRKNTRKRTVDRSEAQFALYFDFTEPESAEENAPDPLKIIMEVCQSWVDKGNQIERISFGVSSRGLHRTSDKQGNITVHSKAFYQPNGEMCCPLGVVLIGTESHFMPLLDAAKVLGVDHFYVVGFVHGFDGQNISTIGRNLEELSKHESYLNGKEAGRIVSAKFVKERQAA